VHKTTINAKPSNDANRHEFGVLQWKPAINVQVQIFKAATKWQRF